jgi:glycosyltransferase involved in cell wall biosynthesis
MDVLLVTADRNVLREQSVEREELKRYATLAEKLVVVAICSPLHSRDIQQVSERLWIIPAPSWGVFAPATVARVVRAHLYFQGRLQIDLVAAHDAWLAGLSAFWIADRYRKPFHLLMREDVFSERGRLSSLLAPLKELAAIYLAHRAHALAVSLETIRTALSDVDTEAADRAVVIAPALDVDAFQNEPLRADLAAKYPAFKFIVLMYAPRASGQDIETGMRAFAEVFKRYEFAGLVVVGPDAGRFALKRLARHLGIAARTVFESSSLNLSSYLKTAHVFLHTALYEEVDTILSKAAAAGCAIVTTDVGFARTIVTDGESGFICKPHDVSGFSGAVLKVLYDSKLREQVRVNGALAIRRYAEAQLAGEGEHSYLQLLADSWQKAVNRAHGVTQPAA